MKPAKDWSPVDWVALIIGGLILLGIGLYVLLIVYVNLV
jgi:hypothetical protein